MATKVNVQFSGITRNTDDGICKDGECMELINARIKNGSIEPIGNPILLSTLSIQYKSAYYHSITDNYLMIRTSDGSVDVYSSDFSTNSILSTSVSGVKRIEFIGNVVCLFTDSGIVYCIYSDGVYKYLGSKPQMPTLSITQNLQSAQVVTKDKYYGPNRVLSQSDINADMDLSKIGYGFFDECISDLNKKGCFVDQTLVRFAFRLFDGNYFMQSPIFLIQENGTIQVTFKFNSTDSGDWYTFSSGKGDFRIVDKSKTLTLSELDYYEYGIVGFKPSFTFPSLNLGAWKDFIMSIDVFACGSIMDHELKESGINTSETVSGQSGKYYNYEAVDGNEIKKNIENKYLFYKIAEFDINGNLVNSLENVSDDNLAVQKSLPDDDGTQTSISAKQTYVYNSRLHLANINQYLFKGYYEDYLRTPSDTVSSTSASAVIYTYINTQSGISIVKRTISANFPYPYITPFLMYPDSRAYKMVIIVTTPSGTVRKEFALTSHTYLNMAYSIVVTSSYLVPLDVSSWSTGTDDISEQNTYENKPNILKVSELNNPIYFPAKTTYKPSNREIMAVCSNTAALSQGQFGEHPLYVFCADGIFAMSVGTDTVYLNSVPISRDVCNNSDSVKGIDSAVVFSTEQGLMMISGSQVNNISVNMNGYLPSSPNTSPIIPKIMKIASLDTVISSVIFKEYCSGAIIGYNYEEREIIVSNPNYTYSYIYSMNSNSWCKLSGKVSSFINTYPDILALSDKVQDSSTISLVYNLQNSHRSISNICIITRPIKIGTNTYKRILQSALRGVVKRSLSDMYLRGESVQFRGDDLTIFSDVGMYILGSQDAENFVLITGREKMVDLRDLVTKMNKSKAYKYFMITLVGGVRTDVSINYMELIIDESYNNRLR